MAMFLKITPEFISQDITERNEHHVDVYVDKIGQLSNHSNKWYMAGNTINITPSGENQLLNTVGVPVKFFKKCPAHLKQENFNYFANAKKDKRHLLRLFVPDKELDLPNQIRAVLSNQYSVHDNHQIFPVALEELSKYNVTFLSLEHDDYVTRVEVRFNDLTIEHEGKTYYAGVSITNSETGHSAIWVEPIVIAPNWIVHNRRTLLAQGANIRSVHRGDFDANRVRKQIQFAREVGQVGIVQILEAQKDMIEKGKALQFIENCDTMPARFANILREEWEDEQEILRLDAWKKILELAKELPLFQRSKIEQDVGQWTGIFKNYQVRIDNIMLEIAEENA